MQWLKLAEQNANHALNTVLASSAQTHQQFLVLQELLSLQEMPNRLECFDISHTMGEATVASCVVFDRQGPVKKDYRRYNILGITKGDDYAALRQALLRRYEKIRVGEGVLPDILFIDGGKGQLAQAKTILEELQINNILCIGIAKGEGRKPGLETLYILGQKKAVHCMPDNMGFHLIQHIRDEAHRFAIAGHRMQAAKVRRTSILEHIPGIGAKRRQALLRHFGGMQMLKKASIEDIAATSGISRELARRIYESLHGE